jgi:hypothetical protein
MPGFILYEGPSELDGAPIVAIAITSSDNRKTGDMLQTYIMRRDVAPLAALKTGEDSSVCGHCPHRPILGGACYVNVGQGPTSVYRALERGNYPATTPARRRELGRGRMVRLGTYGDPMAVPARVWRELLKHAEGHTGYTHQWLSGDVDARQRDAISQLCMASADTPAEREIADSIGLRTFRVRTPDEPVMPGEFVCPASAEAGKRKLCATCGACDGAHPGTRAASPVIVVHGITARRFIAIRAVA